MRGFYIGIFERNPSSPPRSQKFGHIREVQVLKKFQQLGVGRKLIENALVRLKNLGVTDVFLSTSETNNVAKHLYERVGFRQFRKQIQYRFALS